MTATPNTVTAGGVPLVGTPGRPARTITTSSQEAA